MINVEVSSVVNRPCEEVFAFLSDLENNLKWRPGQIEATKTSPGPIGVGTTFRMVNNALGRRLEGEAEVTEYEPNRKFTSIGRSGFMPIVAQRIFEPIDGGTRVTFIATVEPHGFIELAEPLLARRAKAQLGADAANVKRLLEGDPAEAPGKPRVDNPGTQANDARSLDSGTRSIGVMGSMVHRG